MKLYSSVPSSAARLGRGLLVAMLCFQAGSLLAQRNRITRTIDNQNRARLSGHVNPNARAENDTGPLDASEVLSSMSLVFRQSPEQQAALDKLLADQQDPSSPGYHQWLTPEEYGERFGVSQDDIAKIRAWLVQQGLTVTGVARSRTGISFNGTAAQVETAFGSALHHYVVNGKRHFANTEDPSIPVALEGIVASIHGLNDFGFQPRSRRMEAVVSPQYTSSSGNHYLSPADIATIYNVKPLYDAGYTGAGQKMVIPGQTQVRLTDLQQFRTRFGLPAKDPTQILIPTSKDPGFSTDDEGEADLDLEWSAAMAPDAGIIYVYAQNVMDAVGYAIDQNLAPVISLSYGLCEPQSSRALATQLQSWARQANAQGITWFNASGDSGAADCASGTSGGGGFAVDLPASVPEVTGVGGTQFNEAGGAFWNAVNSAAGGSVISYIPEASWNESTAQNPAAGGGGASVLFTKPSWQTGLGVPADGARDVPDVAFSSAAGHDGYLVYNRGSLLVFGGTSAASPVFGGITVLINQYLVASGKLSTPGLGNLNPRLYAVAQSSPGVFHDIVSGNNSVTVTCGSRNRSCTAGTFGFDAGTGYDQATGLGSVDAFALARALSDGVTSPSVSGPPSISGVSNGASFQQTLAPGMVASIFGTNLAAAAASASSVPLPTDLQGVSASVNGIPAPFYYVSPGQLNIQIPYETAPGTATLLVNRNGQTASTSITISAVAPGLFTDASGSLVPSGAAALGQVASLYMTGAGAVSPAIATGAAPSASTAIANLPAPLQSARVTVGGVVAPVQFIGIPVGLAGVVQVNFQLPTNTPLGLQPVVVTIGTVASKSATLLVTN